MKKIIFLLIVISFCSCKKDEVIPTKPYEISADSLEAAKLNVTTAQYLQVKSIMDSFKNQFIEQNKGTSNNVMSEMPY